MDACRLVRVRVMVRIRVRVREFRVRVGYKGWGYRDTVRALSNGVYVCRAV